MFRFYPNLLCQVPLLDLFKYILCLGFTPLFFLHFYTSFSQFKYILCLGFTPSKNLRDTLDHNLNTSYV